eukprot:scaffold1154_cov310-Pinguiococcus_pyrenoidosus.AAC.10
MIHDIQPNIRLHSAPFHTIHPSRGLCFSLCPASDHCKSGGFPGCRRLPSRCPAASLGMTPSDDRKDAEADQHAPLLGESEQKAARAARRFRCSAGLALLFGFSFAVSGGAAVFWSARLETQATEISALAGGVVGVLLLAAAWSVVSCSVATRSGKDSSRLAASKCCGLCRCYRLRRDSDALLLGLCTFAVALLVLGLLVRPAVLEVLNRQIDRETIIDSKEAPSFAAWQANTPDVDGGQRVYYRVYVFSVANPEEVLLGTQKPQLVQTGPYVYDQIFQRLDVKWRDALDGSGRQVITFTEQTYYVPNEEESMPGADDLLDQPTQANLAVEAVRGMLEPGASTLHEAVISGIGNSSLPEDVKEGLENALNGTHGWEVLFKMILCSSPEGHYEGPVNDDPRSRSGEITPFWPRGVRDLWFGYFRDPTLEVLKTILDALAPGTPFFTYMPGIAYNYSSAEDTLARSSGTAAYTGKRKGDFLHQVSRSSINQYELYENSSSIWVCVGTSQNSIVSQNGSAVEVAPYCPHFQRTWNKSSATDAGYVQPWATDAANSVTGTDGSLFKHPIRSSRAGVYIDDIYRSGQVVYTSDKSFRGIDLRRYAIDPALLQNAEENPANAEYFQFGPTGLQNFSRILGFDGQLSKPHFLDADPRLRMMVSGLLPIRSDHDTYLDVEPYTGLAMRVAERLQLNFDFEPIHFKRVPEIEAIAVVAALDAFGLSASRCAQRPLPCCSLRTVVC